MSHLTQTQDIDRLLSDLDKLQKIGKIISVEIDIDLLERTPALEDFLTIQDGIYLGSSSIFVKFDLIDTFDLYQLLNLVFLGMEVDNVIVQLYSKISGIPMIYTVGLMNGTPYPMIFSVSDESLYFRFVESFKLLWMTLR